VFNKALDARYGPSRSVEEYARKAQVAAYESHRAMLESFGARKYVATGVVQWMLNNAWPSLIWHLYDFYLRPGGSYFGAKKAGEPLHVQYSYDDRSVLVVNSTLAAHEGLRATARIVGLDAVERLRREATVDVGPDGVARALVLEEAPDAGKTHFLFLTLDDAAGHSVSRNVYWLSARPERLSDWYVTPVAQYADLTGLAQLPPATVAARVTFAADDKDARARVVLENTSKAVAFFVRARVVRDTDGEELLPVLWEDNDVTLLPGERREILAAYATRHLLGARPALRVDGWNVAPTAPLP
jgi:exo-1,4-beta-D-glucosaminidase